MTHDRLATARRGEALAAAYVTEIGMRVLASNWKCTFGEVDIVAADGDAIVFVEVRTRRGTRFGSPEESISARKKRKLIALAQTYTAMQHWSGPWRIDIVAVMLGPNDKPERITHYPAAIGG